MNMSNMNGTDHGEHGSTAEAHTNHAEHDEAETVATEVSSSFRNTAVTTAATVGVVGVAAIVFEAALIPGMILGVAAALAPTYMPRLGAALNPLLRSGVRGAYKIGRKTREAVSEAREHVNDIVAEVHSEATVTPADLAAQDKPKHSPAV